MKVEDQDPGSRVDAATGPRSETFRTVAPWAALKKSLRNHASLWMSLAAVVGWLLSRCAARRPKLHVPLSDEEEYRARRISLSKDRPVILPMGIDLVVAIGVKMLKLFSKSWSSELLSTRETVARRAADSRPGPDVTKPERIRGLPKSETKATVREQHPAQWYEKNLLALFRNTTIEWIEDKCPQLGASLAYFTIFSLAPLILVLLAVFGMFFGSGEHAREKITEQLQYFIDPSGIKVIKDIATSVAKPTSSILATSLGVIVALFGASGVFGQLQEALNTIWGVKLKRGAGLWGFIRARFLSFAMVAGVCFLLLVSLTIETVLRATNSYLKSILPGGDIVALVIFFLFDLIVIILLFAMIFRYLPDAKIAWRDVWVGATLTAILFVIGKFLLGIYLGSGAAGSAYGAASSLITLLLWIYYAAQIVLFGAEFTQVYTNMYGSHIEPENYAVRVERKEVEVPQRQLGTEAEKQSRFEASRQE
jgi:membrane protein